MDRFELTEHDKVSGLWLRLKDHLTDRLAAARMRNDHSMTEIETAQIRGEIRTLRNLIALDAERPLINAPLL